MTSPYLDPARHRARPPGHAHSEHAPGRQPPVLAAVAVGGALGAGARYGVERLWPTSGTEFPWPILTVNAVGCLAMGALMTVLAARFPRQKKLAGALLGTGFLGGFTTFSHYTDNVRELVRGDAYGTAAAYLLLTVLAALAGVVAGVFAARAAVGVPAHQEASGAR
ncbi:MULTISPECIES: CrcB family protein [Kitasatospora]|uniref:Fluoride-specific ion channel FluC n=1 Tax=Kitasatospora setae (strain ATCC 33774 / DSM 43861 / JCM 3304 / KCC A-0304 / NBRC 14216 / KM-6054) TaxID=452652 RepID=E4N1S6_KITSK|nr:MULTISPECIES: CrcB family protein [Kitasatospora]BAJ32110.1 putative camphor resistance protein CrcB [Kitasatospora setae KM-6054]